MQCEAHYEQDPLGDQAKHTLRWRDYQLIRQIAGSGAAEHNEIFIFNYYLVSLLCKLIVWMCVCVCVFSVMKVCHYPFMYSSLRCMCGDRIVAVGYDTNTQKHTHTHTYTHTV